MDFMVSFSFIISDFLNVSREEWKGEAFADIFRFFMTTVKNISSELFSMDLAGGSIK